MHGDLLKGTDNDSLKWEVKKMEIRNATTVYNKTQAVLKQDYENNLHKKYKHTIYKHKH